MGEVVYINEQLVRSHFQLELLAATMLGMMDLKGAQSALREAMVRLALERCGGSRRAAAKLLGVDRAYVSRLSQKLNA
jgi:hypothetical protein